MEFASRYFEVLAQQRWLLVAFTLAIAFSWLTSRRVGLVQLGAMPMPRVAQLLLLLACVCWAIHLAWLCDDAFIVFRYARNWAHGYGPVWNVGERVEGYTDFLWMALLALGIRLGAAPELMSLSISLLGFVGALLLVDLVLLRVEPRSSAWLRLGASAALGFNYTFASFATSGLETMLACTLLLAAVERCLASSLLLAGACATAAGFMHPDHLLFYAALGGCLIWQRAPLSSLARFALPGFASYVPYFVWRYGYYGELLPNTFYAKSGGGSYFAQGGTYLAASFVFGGLWCSAFWLARGLVEQSRSLLGRFMLLGVAPYLVYVAKIGGDYMYGRLLVSALPLCVICAALGAHAWLSKHARGWPVLLMALAIFILPTPAVPARKLLWNMSDERTNMSLSSLLPVIVDSPLFRRAQLFRLLFSAPSPKPLVAEIEIGMLGYYTGLPIIDMFGLTDRQIAHQVLKDHGRPGHEKRATREYLLQRRVALCRQDLFADYSRFTRIALPIGGEYFMARWDPELAKLFERLRDVHIVDMPSYLDNYLHFADQVPSARLRADWSFFRHFYFDGNADPARRSAFEALLAQRR